jgi:hypothetical protein
MIQVIHRDLFGRIVPVFILVAVSIQATGEKVEGRESWGARNGRREKDASSRGTIR